MEMFHFWVCFFILMVNVLDPATAQMGEKISFKMPDMTDEEQHSEHVPYNLKCDACMAVVYQMEKQLQKAERNNGGRVLKESDYLDVFEKACEWSSYENYGIKSVNGVNRISGEGLEANDVAGMLGGGGRWPGRLSQQCGTLVGDIGEDDIYKEYRKRKSLKNFLCKEQSKDCVRSTKDEL